MTDATTDIRPGQSRTWKLLHQVVQLHRCSVWEHRRPTGPVMQPETFDREYVRKLRDEAAGHRVKVEVRRRPRGPSGDRTGNALTGCLPDPTDLPITPDLLDDDGLVDDEKVTAATDEMLARKPHLAARRRTGNVGQRARPEDEQVGLQALLRRGA